MYRTPDEIPSDDNQALCRVYERAIKRQFDNSAIVAWENEDEKIRVQFRSMTFIAEIGSDDDTMYFFNDEHRLVVAALSFDEQDEVTRLLENHE